MRPAHLNPRIAEIVGELDRVVPVVGAQAIVYVELFWQTYPHVERYEQYTAFLATPTGFARFGIEYMKAALTTRAQRGPRGDIVDIDVDYLLRQDSNLEIACERVARDLARPLRNVRAAPFDWDAVSPGDAPSWLPLLRELETLVSPGEAEVGIEARYRESVIQMTTNEAGLLRFGLEFAKTGFARGVARGRHGGEFVNVDLAYLGGVCDLLFECERVPALPPGGLRHRGTEVPGIVVAGVAATVLVLAMRACLVSR